MHPRQPTPAPRPRSSGRSSPVGRLQRIRLGRLTVAEWALLLRAQHALLLAEWSVRTRRTGNLLATTVPTGARWSGTADADTVVARTEDSGAPVGLSAVTMRQAWPLVLAVHRAARFGVFRPRCLTRSIALQRLLVARRLPAEIRVGVRRTGGALVAHAWVELSGAVLGDERAHVREYTPLADFRVTR